MHKHCLILNADFRPIGILSWKKSMVLLYRINTGMVSAQVLNYHTSDFIKKADGELKTPSVIKINDFRNLYNKKIKFTRRNVFCRDNYTCQYCGQRFDKNKLTYDHIVPKSRIKQTNKFTHWTNIVTACQKCNRRKANRTPDEAQMRLLKKPTMPQYSSKFLTHYIENSTIGKHAEWLDFLG
jgi:5-methylcytosine-specific restriction endonuclease McrA